MGTVLDVRSLIGKRQSILISPDLKPQIRQKFRHEHPAPVELQPMSGNRQKISKSEEIS
jgi:hypothetical protein